MFYLIGLGNPGDEYKNTRHNIGRETVEFFCKKNDFNDFAFDKKSNSLIAKGKIGKEPVMAVLPETFMNNSGKAVSYFVKNKKQAENLDGLLARIGIAHEIGYWLGIALTFIFLSIEMGPIFFKMITGIGH
jgi:hypothetical protein